MTLSKTVRDNRDRILAAIELGLSNSKLEGLNSKIRLINHRGYGHHSAPPSSPCLPLLRRTHHPATHGKVRRTRYSSLTECLSTGPNYVFANTILPDMAGISVRLQPASPTD